MQEGKRGAIGAEFAAGLPSGQDRIGSPAFARTVWSRVIANAERHDQPGLFTTFAGYEWSSMPAGANLHRIVIFADGPERMRTVVPFRSIDSADPEALWAYLADTEKKTGGRVLAIPHNSNLSAGRMFERVDFRGKPFTKRYAAERIRWEPLVEATQIKGDSETAPELSPDDEFGNHGVWDSRAGMGVGPHENWMYEFEYVRPALGHVLALGAALGVNSFAFGLIGSTDSHTGLSTADDADFWRKFSSNDVAVSGGRAIGADGRCRTPVGNTVDVARASDASSIGAAELTAVWRDPAFDRKRAAVYTLRVLEIPTPRWTSYDAARYGTAPETGVEHTTQERAYTSPI